VNRAAVTTAFIGLCAMIFAHGASAQSSPFVGRWQWNQAESAVPPGEPAPKEVTAEISRMDGTHVNWSLTVLADDGEKSIESFEALTNGEFHPVNSDTTAAFTLLGNALQATFKGPMGQTDTLTCSLSMDHRKMTCNGMIDNGDGRKTSYVDVYDRR
jgi:hypothetical protein